ncbi:ABC transporter permease [Leucothrix arctica]|uniref:ABC transporter permease n=2 Tax=Leucothrix arctica TaxID=1481894 RepID=A0A317CPY5_9GAMM|nr:ABC transporter permease [Leucothrix arctica]
MMNLSKINRRRFDRFKSNRKAVWSFWLFTFLFVVSLFSEFVANDKPLIVSYDNQWYYPVLNSYPETLFGGEFETEAEYKDPFVVELIEEKGWLLFPIVRYSHQTVISDLPSPAPSGPTAENWLGTDEHGRDLFARILYGFRLSVLFGFILTIASAVIGVSAGAVQGYYGGWLDLLAQRFMEVWGSMPMLYIVIILASVVQPSFWVLLVFMLLFSWMSFVGVVRAEFLRCRNYDYVKAARVMGMSDRRIMFKHILPNAMVATMTFMPIVLSGSITALTGLDFLGFGLPPGSASLGELLSQAKNNLQAPWIGFSVFAALGIMTILLVFVGEGVRDAFDPRQTY